ncbi:MAG: hypothetical protein KAH25_13035, partial [Bacteroidales bacterium]|nr:hypothetical protein [Bacteroidales bacterium]
MKISIKTIIYSIVAFYLILLGCQKPASQDPIINVNSIIQGLEVFLEISITDPEDQITEFSVNWGDQTNGNTYSSDIHELNHYYSDPGIYDIKISAGDNNSVILTKNVKVDMDFKETSLDNIKPNLFKSSEKEILVLTINLHTYQESQQNEKFNLLVDVIGKMDVDFIALQECAQHKSAAIHEGIIREDNMALIIANRVKEKYAVDYNFVWNWAHYGWNVWEEGVAILSKHTLIDTDERYISSNTSVSNIQSRKVIYGSYQMDDGILNVFSAHTHWRTSTTDQEHNNQINNIKQMVVEKEAENMAISAFVCGDFNVNP